MIFGKLTCTLTTSTDAYYKSIPQVFHIPSLTLRSQSNPWIDNREIIINYSSAIGSIRRYSTWRCCIEAHFYLHFIFEISYIDSATQVTSASTANLPEHDPSLHSRHTPHSPYLYAIMRSISLVDQNVLPAYFMLMGFVLVGQSVLTFDSSDVLINCSS